MIRLSIFFTIFIAGAMTSLNGEEPSLDVTTKEMRTFFYELWKASRYGMDSNQTERAAWILKTESGEHQFQVWPSILKGRQDTWFGAKPRNMVGLVHTHPVSVDPRPSKFDAQLAARIHAPIFTISRSGIWRVEPGGRNELQAGEGWFKDVQMVLAEMDSEH